MFEQGGVPSYWMVDPFVPRLTALELVDGTYAEVARVQGDEACTLERPFPITVTPLALLR